jgi:hypothetical protein
MRLAHTAFAFLISTGCVLALTADARAGASCKTQTFQGQALAGNTQYLLGSNSCTPLTKVEVTVFVNQDIIVGSSTPKGPGFNGFAMQLNANGPSSGLTPSQLYFQQFVIEVGSGGVKGHTQQFPSGGPVIFPGNNILIGAPFTLNNTFLTIPGGTTFKWTLFTDSKGNVESVTYSAKDELNPPTHYTRVTEKIPAEVRAPIYSLEMEIVGFNLGSFTTFQSGAGTITYKATSFSASYDSPACAQYNGTAENSNMRYESLNAVSSGTFTQEFCAPLPAPGVTRINSTVNAVNNAPGGPDGPCGNVGGLQNGTPGTTRTEAEWFNTCGNRLCISLGFQDGRVVEYTSTTDINAPVVLSCFTVDP